MKERARGGRTNDDDVSGNRTGNERATGRLHAPHSRRARAPSGTPFRGPVMA